MSRSQTGQTLLELVVGMSLITVVIGALAIITTYSLRNTQFSKNQTQGTDLAQENLEKVRTIRSANYGVCLPNEALTNCSSWDNIWTRSFGAGEKYTIANGCTVNGSAKPYCLQYWNSLEHAPISNTIFSGEITISDEVANQKKVTSKIYWTDSSGEHTSDLVTIFSKL